jgi:sugar lactone lactonase YvrE
MSPQQGRYRGAKTPKVAEGWKLDRLTPVSRLYAANGMRIGPDGRLYVAECVGSQVSAVDTETGDTEIIVQSSDTVSPDDLAFDERGNLYITEYMAGRISMRGTDGRTRVLNGDLPGANGITFHQGRMYVDECRMGGRLYEFDPNGGAPRIILEGLVLPNALAPGPDGKLYFPSVGADEIWRVDPAGGKPAERVRAGCHHPVALKFDSKGYIISPQSTTGEVWRIDPQTGNHTVIAKLPPCMDNLAFKGERLFISHLIDGRITEILDGGNTREVLPGGLQFPLDMAIGGDGHLYFTDNSSMYVLPAGGKPKAVGWMFGPGFPGTVRGLASLGGDAFVVTTSDGRVARYRPAVQENEVLAQGFDQLYGLAVTSGGAVIVAERGAGRVHSIDKSEKTVLATGLKNPMGVAVTPDGTCLFSEEGAGRVAKVTKTGTETVVDGLQQPHGIAVRGNTLYIVDAGAHAVIAYDMASRARSVVAGDLPVGDPPGLTRVTLPALAPFSGPLGPFAGITAADDGALYFAADTEGSVMKLQPLH